MAFASQMSAFDPKRTWRSAALSTKFPYSVLQLCGIADILRDGKTRLLGADTQFEFVINLRTTKTLGLTGPPGALSNDHGINHHLS